MNFCCLEQPFARAAIGILYPNSTLSCVFIIHDTSKHKTNATLQISLWGSTFWFIVCVCLA